MHILNTSRIHNWCPMSNPSVRRFEEQCRLFRGCYLEFRCVVGEVQGQANHRVWHNRWQKCNLILTMRLPCFVKQDAGFGQFPFMIEILSDKTCMFHSFSTSEDFRVC